MKRSATSVFDSPGPCDPLLFILFPFTKDFAQGNPYPREARIARKFGECLVANTTVPSLPGWNLVGTGAKKTIMDQQTPKAIGDCHALLEWLLPQPDKFPRPRRFTLGERMESGMLAVLENLMEAAYSRAKAEPLQRANLKLNVVLQMSNWELGIGN
uniref:Uncharacterized protein n=1 Tax=Candidatus Kentrum eta TaxID=2126337 RepID=A0A450V202_9GAMM|nr:MAG: hypothetical protein BECKH772B_GA0070898_1002313 [Candidatus Kentron sp. H]VFJ98811.1 MAG: hypothetical protein BECKH772C_GA0070978_1002514 [Candidatus Kentron sp. H]